MQTSILLGGGERDSDSVRGGVVVAQTGLGNAAGTVRVCCLLESLPNYQGNCFFITLQDAE